MLDECMQGVMAHLSSCNKVVPTHLVRVLRSWLAPAALRLSHHNEISNKHGAILMHGKSNAPLPALRTLLGST